MKGRKLIGLMKAAGHFFRAFLSRLSEGVVGRQRPPHSDSAGHWHGGRTGEVIYS